MQPTMRRAWPFGFNLILFAAVAFNAPFLVLYYQGGGFTGAQIGLLTGIAPLVTLLCAPLWTALADATGRHRLIMSLSLFAAALVMAALPFADSVGAVLAVIVLFNAFFAPMLSFADSATMYMLADQKELYGRVRLGGTFGFGLAALLAGLVVQAYGLEAAFWCCAALLLVALAFGQKLAHNPLKAGVSAGPGVRLLLGNPRWLLFLAVAFAGGVALAGANNYLLPYMRLLGARESTMGLALTLGTLTEIPVLYFGHVLLRRFKPYRLLMVSMGVTGARFLLLAAADRPSVVLLTQLLHGLTFVTLWMAGVAYADKHAPAGLSATAQGLFSAMVLGLGNAVGGLAGGPLLEQLGGRGLYLIFGLFVLVMVGAATVVNKVIPQEAEGLPESAAG